jgi:hypothetical protein
MLAPTPSSRAALATAWLGLALSSCGAAHGASVPARSCAGTVDEVLRNVARRTYHQAAAGRNVTSATRRLARSTLLSEAVARGDRRATRAALRPLLRNQIKRIAITRDGRTLARFGHEPALAPVHGVIRDAAGAVAGRYTLSVAGDAAIAGFIHALTGARVTIAAAARAGTSGFRVTAFPSGSLHVSLADPPVARSVCAPSGAATVAGAVGEIGRRLFRAESDSAATQRVLRIVARDHAFLAAVAHDDPAALRAQIVRFFRDRTLHVVRIRAVRAGGRLVNDVGGPYVLAPASRTLRAHGRTLGRVTLSIQDDTGYIKLVHRTTGAHVALRTAAGPVPGSERPPVGGGQDYAFTARAYPTGPLRVSLALSPADIARLAA